MLRAEVISHLSPQDRLVEEWSGLADRCASATIFQTSEWLATWWRTIGAGGRGRSLYIVTIRDGSELVGLAPLMATGWYVFPVRRLCFLGAGVTDYNDIIAEPGREDEVAAFFYEFLANRSDWDLLDFREIRDGAILRRRPPSPSNGLAYSDWPLEACPFLALPSDGSPKDRWTAILSAYSKKVRANVGYYERNLQRAFQVDSRIVAESSELPEAFEMLFELHRRRWNRRWLPGVFASDQVRAFHIAAAGLLLDRGNLRLHVLRLDDEVQAVLYAFAFHDRTCYYQGGFEPDLARYSLGSVLIAGAIRQAVNEGFSTFDFLRGNEDYKRRWTTGESVTNIRRLVSRRPGTALRFAEKVHVIESRIELAAKERFAGGIVRKGRKRSHPAPSEQAID